FIAKLETAYRRDERLLRFLTFKMEKYAIKYSETRRNAAKKEEVKEN
ncbi:MAG: 30S ribosomal protein S6, partial [Bacteroidales bacterium]|nr:30S ribosomal protein S6 [Bacteroidales bacterium]